MTSSPSGQISHLWICDEWSACSNKGMGSMESMQQHIQQLLEHNACVQLTCHAL